MLDNNNIMYNIVLSQLQKNETPSERWHCRHFANFNLNYLPNKIGRNSLYVMCWMMAMTNFLASWYSISSVHWGLSCANSVAKKLCNRKRATCDTAMSGCWFTRPSPNWDRQKLVSFEKNSYNTTFSPSGCTIIIINDAYTWCLWPLVVCNRSIHRRK